MHMPRLFALTYSLAFANLVTLLICTHSLITNYAIITNTEVIRMTANIKKVFTLS